MSGIRGRSGRKKTLSTLVNEAIDSVDEALPDIFESLINKAKLKISVTCPECKQSFEIPGGGDKDCAIYLADRRLGRPKQAIDQTIKGEILITPDMRALAAREMIEIKEEEAKLLKESDDALQGQG